MTEPDDTHSQPKHIGSRLRAGDSTLIELFDHPVSVNEAHSIVLGVSIGFFLGKSGQPVVAASTAAYATLKPTSDSDRIGTKTVTHEPWYFTGSLLAGYLAGKFTRICTKT